MHYEYRKNETINELQILIFHYFLMEMEVSVDRACNEGLLIMKTNVMMKLRKLLAWFTYSTIV